MATAIVQAIRKFVRDGRMVLHAYCLMPDHLHIVATPQTGLSIAKLMQDFKISTCMAGCDCGIYESIWDKVLYLPVRDDPQALRDICRFVASNPVRNGLVKDQKHWRHVWVSKSLVPG